MTPERAGDAVNVNGFDHLVLRTTDVERLLDFYLTVLGLAPVRLEDWRAGRAPFPSARISQTAIIDFVPVDEQPTGSVLDHFCLVVDPVDWNAEIAAGLAVTHGPVSRYGAQGVATSVYVTDPDGNVVELRHYG
ncbi:MAG TPA: VOC family protein [Mycobacteriales bacterium]